ncbi:MAG: putative DNA binding domain-containing protein [Candidatus Methanoplasma sp.]|nr:putative DNA binding domain-containing protein [Candidatus Methanoplasma sp.]
MRNAKAEDFSEIISREICGGETNRLEFKSQLPPDSKSIVKTAVAFSNSSGGKILVGVDDKGKVIGVPDDDLFKIKDMVADAISNSARPQITPEVFVVTADGKSIIVIRIPPGLLCPYYVKSLSKSHGTYIRVGGISIQADSETIKGLEIRGRGLSFDGLDYPAIPADDDSIDALCTHLSSFGKEKFTVQNLVNLGVLKENVSEYVATFAFALLTSNPFPHSIIQCACFAGNDDSTFRDRRELTGSIIDQVNDAVGFVAKHINIGGKLDGIVMKDIYEVPKDAIREAIVNAVVHRDYRAESGTIHISVFDNRIDILSPGLPLGFDINDLTSGRSEIRNRVLASVFKSTGFIEQWGTGINKIIRLCRESGLAVPEFREEGTYFRVILHRPKPQDYISHLKGNARTNTVTLTKNEARVYELISRGEFVNRSDAAEALDISESSVSRAIRSLRDKGAITRIGTRKNGTWTASD